MYIHDHATWVEEVVKAYCQAHGFNDDNHWIIFWM
jgi:hypothetical protein